METIKFKYKGYMVELGSICDADSNYNTFLHVFKKGAYMGGEHVKHTIPLNSIIDKTESIIRYSNE